MLTETNMTNSSISRRGLDGFTRTELAVVVTTAGFLGLLLLTTMGAAKSDSKSFQCMENHRRLMRAWHMYAEDNGGILAPNEYPYNTSFVTFPSKNQLRNWVVGTFASPFDRLGPAQQTIGAAQSLLYSYVQSVSFYQCPADTLVLQGKAANRNYSMSSAIGTRWYSSKSGNGNYAVGTPVGGGWLSGTFMDPDPNYVTFGKLNSLYRPGPANTWVLIDENPATINDGMFCTAMPSGGNIANTRLIDYPAGSHGRAAGISFADGHAEIRKWQDPRTYTPPPSSGPGSVTASTSPNNADVLWLSQRTTVPK